jgi:hypothetical protein
MLLFVLENLESYSHNLIQSTTPILLLVEDPSKEKFLDNFQLALIFTTVLYAKGVYGSETNGIMTQTQRMHPT